MTAPVSSRQRILESIRAATVQPSSAGRIEDKLALSSLPRAYIRRGSMNRGECLERLIERLREYDAELVECSPEQLPATIAAQLASSGRQIFVAPEGLPSEWQAPGFEWKIDRNLAIEAIEHAAGVVTAATCGVADSGTI